MEQSQLFDDSQQQTQTQPQTQQVASQTLNGSPSTFPSNLWGILTSHVAATRQQHDESSNVTGTQTQDRPLEVKLDQTKLAVKIGRHPRADIVLKGAKISSWHAKLWFDTNEATVKLEDTSSNGTFVRNVRVGKGNRTIIEPGDEIIFGPASGDWSADFRYTFKGPSNSGTTNLRAKSFGFEEADQSGIKQAYELREQIGKGSFASVYKGVQKSTGKLVAIKKINKARFASNPKTLEMFAREVEIMKDLDHKFCVKCMDSYEDADRIWLVLEYIDGGDLLEYVIQHHGLKEHETREIALMVCEAVAYLHSKGVAHRDLKPENLLLTRGNRPLCKVTDFGLAKMVDNNTKLKTMCGTPTYLAPEVVLKKDADAAYGPAVDAWSIGIILYACLTNTTPFDESESTPLPQRVAERRVDMTAVREVGASEMAIDFISKLLINDPNNRLSVHDALKHPWLVTKVREDSAVVPLLVSSLPYNKKDESIVPTAVTNNSDSFVDSQGFERLRLQSSTPARPRNVSIQGISNLGQTSPDGDRTVADDNMTEDLANTSIGNSSSAAAHDVSRGLDSSSVMTSGNVEDDSPISDSATTRMGHQVRFRNGESIVGSGLRFEQSSMLNGDKGDEVDEPKSAFSSASDVVGIVKSERMENLMNKQDDVPGLDHSGDSVMSIDEIKSPVKVNNINAPTQNVEAGDQSHVDTRRTEESRLATPAPSEVPSVKRERDDDDENDRVMDMTTGSVEPDSSTVPLQQQSRTTPRRSSRRSSIVNSSATKSSSAIKGTPRRRGTGRTGFSTTSDAMNTRNGHHELMTPATTVSTASSESPEAQTPPPQSEFKGMTTRRRAKAMRFA
ncbi:hypothetical protein OIO90_001189 [Microbotryomycetes sp. JL221]|nr:hypothetical protein OIO90_001189 [Microbotryomycetes sp. JL221]